MTSIDQHRLAVGEQRHGCLVGLDDGIDASAERGQGVLELFDLAYERSARTVRQQRQLLVQSCQQCGRMADRRLARHLRFVRDGVLIALFRWLSFAPM